VIIGKERPNILDNKIWSRNMVLEKPTSGKEKLKITVKTSGFRGGGGGKLVAQIKVGALFNKEHIKNWSANLSRTKNVQAGEF
jgi:hypothetical protein